MGINHQEVVHQWKKAVKKIVRLCQADTIVTDDTPRGGCWSSQQNSREAEDGGCKIGPKTQRLFKRLCLKQFSPYLYPWSECTVNSASETSDSSSSKKFNNKEEVKGGGEGRKRKKKGEEGMEEKTEKETDMCINLLRAAIRKYHNKKKKTSRGKRTNSGNRSKFKFFSNYSVQFSSVAQSCPTLCDPMNRSMPGLPVYHQLLEFFTQSLVHQVSDAIQPSHPWSSPSPAPNPSQHQSPLQWVNSSHEVAKVLEFQL